ncbi:hypothetical protein M433DRAFT_153667 [Acidomyces richmondensis BFW]|nr:MAG: hypothetical protein FE78DRAFT_89453 [Acidomyces sp. 'richmondensis']KYG46166.1 hypothetical protein M433DRAFT_153667 [Acidomyces richmondensis BFW]
MPQSQDDVELDSLNNSGTMDERDLDDEITSQGSNNTLLKNYDEHLNKRTVRKLDFILLPFLALLFLLNSLDKSNIGNAETAGFTRDAGLSPNDLNISMACFFAFFVALQPVGAALGRKFGMARWVPTCMSFWGLSTILHIWVRRRWQLICLRVTIATLEAGFYPTTVSYLSLFYTRYEFAVRLGFFYGQTAVAGALGGVLSWAVFNQFPNDASPNAFKDGMDSTTRWRSWRVLFLIEGCMTMVVALIGFFWLPHSANSAWFLNASERQWAEERIRLDRLNIFSTNIQSDLRDAYTSCAQIEEERALSVTHADDGDDADDDDDTGNAHQRLLDGHRDTLTDRRRLSTRSTISFTADAGLTRHDVLSAILNYKIWHLLMCNILSAIPATAFGVFLPLVIKELSPSLDLSAAASNLLAAPPFAFGAIVLFLFTLWSDRSHQRLVPILWGLGLLLVGLIVTVMSNKANYVLRYISLCVLLSGSFIASPLTVAWLTNNTPEPGKRAILLGINGWGNLAGVFSALLFTPEDEKQGYIRPFIITLACVVASFAGFIVFWILLVRENRWRDNVTENWTENEKKRENMMGDVPITQLGVGAVFWERSGLKYLANKMGLEDDRRGDEKMTFRYGL